MKIIGLVGSPNKNGNTSFLVSEVLKSAKSQGADTELLFLADYNIQDCKGCNNCVKHKKCPQWETDDFHKVIAKLLDANAVVFGAPSYGGSVPGLMKRFLDRCRLMRMQDFKLKNKIATFVTTAGLRSGGQELVAIALANFALMEGMLVVGDCSDPVGVAPFAHGALQTDTGWRFVKNDSVAIKGAQALGKRVVDVMELLKTEK